MSDSFISVRCPRCNALASVNADQEGETVICRRCEQEMLVPGQRKNPDGDSVDSLINLDDDVLPPVAKLSRAEDNDDVSTDDGGASSSMPQNTDSKDKSLQQEDGLPELTDWSNYRRSNPKAGVADEPADDSTNTESSETPKAESSDNEIDDLLISVTQSSTDPEPTVGKDPFAVDHFAALKIDGITPADSEFPVTCNVCGSLMYARLSQVGTKLKCHDCYSMITINAPRKVPEDKGKPKKADPPRPEYDESEGYRLEPESKLAPIDTTIDLSLGEIDYDDDDFFEKRREQESADPEIFDDPTPGSGDESKAVSRKSAADGVFEDESDDQDNGDEYGLAPVQDDVSPKKTGQTVFESMDDLLAEYPASKTTPVVKKPVDQETERPIVVVPIDEPEGKPAPVAEKSKQKDVKGKEQSKPKAEKTTRKKNDPASFEDVMSPFAGFGGWIGKAMSVVMEPMNLARIGMGTVLLGFGYLMLFGGLSNFDPEKDVDTINKFGGYLLIGISSILIAATFFMLAVHSSSVIRDAIEQRSSKGEWPDFSIADFVSQFLYVGTSFWLAAVPGVIVGQVFWIVTDNFYFLPGFLVASSVMLAPFFLSSVVFNDSPMALVSGDAFVSISKFRYRWIRYWIASLLLSIAFVAALAGASLGTIFAFLFPMIQLTLAIMLFWMVGDLTGYIVRFMEQKGEA